MPCRSTRSPRWRESPRLEAARRVRERGFEVVFDVRFFELEEEAGDFVVPDVLGAGPPRPTPPLGVPFGEVSAAAGAASINAAASAATASAASLRSTCVAREDDGYDKHNPFSFV